MIISPCISICKTDPVSGLCYGCAETMKKKEYGKMKVLWWMENQKFRK